MDKKHRKLLAGIILVLAGAALIFWAVTNDSGDDSRPSGQSSTPSQDMQQNGDIDVQTIILEAIAPYSGNGEANRSWDGTTFSHTVVANIADPADGKFYEGWLVKDAASGQFVSTGMLDKQDGSFVLEFTSGQNMYDYSGVVITEETSAAGLDGVPEDHVLEGSF